MDEYLLTLLTKIDLYELTPDEKNSLSSDKVGFMMNKLIRKKFRRRHLSEKTKGEIERKVKLSFEEKRPLHFTVPFGGYKHFWNSSAPLPDWAELFNFRYLTEYILPILTVYEPGVIIEYISEDVILTRMNNYPKDYLEKYNEGFQTLLNWYSKFVPKNLEFRFFRVGQRFDKDKIIERVESLLPERKVAFERLSNQQKDQELHRSYRSMFWHGEKDLSSLNEDEKEKRIIESRLIELAYYETEAQPEFLGNYLNEDNHICICFSFGTTHDNDVYEDLTLGSTFSSIVDFWIGRGILEYGKQKYTPRIVSKKQYEEIKSQLKTIKLKTPLLDSDNYKTIEVWEI